MSKRFYLRTAFSDQIMKHWSRIKSKRWWNFFIFLLFILFFLITNRIRGLTLVSSIINLILQSEKLRRFLFSMFLSSQTTFTPFNSMIRPTCFMCLCLVVQFWFIWILIFNHRSFNRPFLFHLWIRFKRNLLRRLLPTLRCRSIFVISFSLFHFRRKLWHGYIF